MANTDECFKVFNNGIAIPFTSTEKSSLQWRSTTIRELIIDVAIAINSIIH